MSTYKTPQERYELALIELAVAGTESAGKVLAILDSDVDHCPALHDGYEVQCAVDDSRVSESSDSGFHHGIYNVEHTARWTTAQSLCGPGTLDSDTAASEFIGPRAPALGDRYRARFSAVSYHRAETARVKAVDKRAFPYLYKANGQRCSVRSTQGYNAARKRMLEVK